MIEKQLVKTFAKLIVDARNTQYADTYEREVAYIKLQDGRAAKVMVKIETNERDW